ncbi:MAG: sigma-70 family RNA polymerase sigma factor [Eubacterium sp.]|nr:sigma-70 family RNA polymerase sigma factor [Eubacterium sp.]
MAYIRLQEEEENRLLRLAQNGDPSALERLAEQYLGYIRWVSNRVIVDFFAKDDRDGKEEERIRASMDDLVQAGCLGFLMAVEKYEEEKKVRFVTASFDHIYWAARQEMLRQMDRLGMKGSRKRSRNAVSLDEENGLAESLFSEEDLLQDFIDSEEEEEHSEILVKTCSALTEEERQVLFLYYGIDDDPETDYRKIGKELGIPELKARVLFENAMKKLRGLEK